MPLYIICTYISRYCPAARACRFGVGGLVCRTVASGVYPPRPGGPCLFWHCAFRGVDGPHRTVLRDVQRVSEVAALTSVKSPWCCAPDDDVAPKATPQINRATTFVPLNASAVLTTRSRAMRCRGPSCARRTACGSPLSAGLRGTLLQTPALGLR